MTELFAAITRSNLARERMAYILNVRHATFGVPALLERQNRKQQVDVAAHNARAIRAPGPQLRTYVVNDPKAPTMKPARQAQIEIRPINQNHGGGFSFNCRMFQFSKSAPEFRQGT